MQAGLVLCSCVGRDALADCLEREKIIQTEQKRLKPTKRKKNVARSRAVETVHYLCTYLHRE